MKSAFRLGWSRSTTLSSAISSGIVLAGGLLVGGLTSPGQGLLPPWINSLSNSAGGWSMFAFLLVWLSRARPVLGVVLGVVAFEAMLEAYGVVSIWRGYYYAEPLHNQFTLPGVGAGLVLGSCAAVVRHSGRRSRRVLAVVPLSIVLVAEGVYCLLFISDTTSPVYWALEVVAGAAFIALALVWRRRASRHDDGMSPISREDDDFGSPRCILNT